MVETTKCRWCGEPIRRLPGRDGWYVHVPGMQLGCHDSDPAHEAGPEPAPSLFDRLSLINDALVGGAA